MLEEFKLELEALAVGRRIADSALVQSRQDGCVEIGGRRLVDFANWDFLSVNGAHRAKVARAAQVAIERAGVGSRSARLLSGRGLEHVSCERALSRISGHEAALLFSSKNQAIFSFLTSILNERDAVLCEENYQAPVSDAAYLVNATAQTFSNASGASLGAELEKLKNFRRKFVVVEALSVMTGFEVDLPALSALCARFGAELIVDVSASLGVLGIRGEGAKDPIDVALPPLCVVGDLGVSLGVFGGFIAGPALLMSYLEDRSRSFLVEPMLPPALAAAIEGAVEVAELAHGAREDLKRKARFMRKELEIRKFSPVCPALDSPILSLPFPRLSAVRKLSHALSDRGFYVEPAEPRLPKSESCYLRVLVNVLHSEKQLQELASEIAELTPRIFSR